jgi:hypothetical protein
LDSINGAFEFKARDDGKNARKNLDRKKKIIGDFLINFAGEENGSYP